MNKFVNWAHKKTPELLLAFGIGSMMASVVFAVKATSRAHEIIEAENVDASKPEEVIKAVWKPYIPAAVAFAVGSGCIIGSHSVDVSRNAALMAAYTVSDTALKEYTAKTKEIFGEEADQKVREAVSEDKKDKTKETIIVNSSDFIIYKDSITGREIHATKNMLDEAVNEFNELLRNEDFATANDWFYCLGLKPVYPIGDTMGWNINDGYLKLDTWENDRTEDDKPCALIKYSPAPRLGFQFRNEKLVECC